MAKVTGPIQQPRAPALRGAFVIDNVRGTLRVRKWPRPRGKNVSPKQREAIETFREAAIAAKYAPAADQMRSRELAHGSQFLPRDLQYMAIYGRLFSIFGTKGERRYSVASRNDLTELLDILGFAPGTILARGPDYWSAITPGEVGQVLTALGGQQMPTWADPGGGGSGGFSGGTSMGANTMDTEDFAMKLQICVPRQTLIVSAMWVAVDSSSSVKDHIGHIVRLDGTDSAAEIVEIIGQTERAATGNTDYTWLRLPFDEPVTLLGGQPYGIGGAYPDTAPDDAFRIVEKSSSTGDFMMNAPVDMLKAQLFYEANAPTVGQVADFFGGERFYVTLDGLVDD